MGQTDPTGRVCAILERIWTSMSSHEDRLSFGRLKATMESYRWYPQSEDGRAAVDRAQITFCDMLLGLMADKFVIHAWSAEEKDTGCRQTDTEPVITVKDVCYVGIPIEQDGPGPTDADLQGA